ncbi:MAG: ATP-binding cassette domain-containing protein [Phycisphaerales bacterium]|nr:ATP-binding cassette domain-containing protein [Phycisphaerales bacterium]
MKFEWLAYGGRHLHAPDPSAHALRLVDVSVGYPGSKDPVLSGVSFTLPVGARLALVGPNGSGKSTLLKSIAGLLPCVGGDIAVFGLKVRACHHRTSYLPQREEIAWQFPVTVQRFVLGGRYVHCGWFAKPDSHDHAVVQETLRELDIVSLQDAPIDQLSGGQQQRVMLARALAQGSDLLLLDEPLNAVDSATRTLVGKVLDRLQKAGKSMIVSTHDVGTHDQPFDGVLILENGSVREMAHAAAV